MRIAIVEDSDLVHDGLVRLLDRCPRASVVGRAVSESAALRLVQATAPDVVLLDLHLQPGSGLGVLRSLRRDGYAGHVLMMTAQDGDVLRQRCIAEGADGYYDKHAGFERLLERLRTLSLPGARPPVQAPPDPGVAMDTALDAVARRAAELAGCPMGAVSLACGNRQWMVARSGFDLRCVSRNISLCTHVGDALFEVADTWSDARFALNPMIEPPFAVRFYAGMPIVLPSGERVGVLCVWASEPGGLDAAQRDGLARLADEAARHVERLQPGALVERERLAQDGPPDAPACHLDPLTGLRGRDALLHGPAPVVGEGLLCIDLDRFSQFNHALGREATDGLLTEVALRLASQAQGGVAARLAGDEFALRLPGPHDEASLRKAGETVAAAIGRPIQAGGHTVRLCASIGMALAGPGGDCNALLARAELAMRHAEQAGGNACQLYAPWMGRRADDRLQLEEDLRAALLERQFVIEYQPLLALPGGELLGAEALVRWRHPRRGLLAPDAFIGVLEEIGLIGELGAQVLDGALAQLVDWDAAGVSVPRVSVNVSALQLEAGFAAVVEDALSRHSLPAARLELEITESALPRDDEAGALLQRLRHLGVALAVDDFGTGYSSLASLRCMPVGTLKIDRHFIGGLGTAPQDVAVVGAIVSMAHSLGMRATAEGVETAAQEAHVVALGCDVVQGYRYSRPLAPDAFVEWFGRASPRTPPYVADCTVSRCPAPALQEASPRDA